MVVKLCQIDILEKKAREEIPFRRKKAAYKEDGIEKYHEVYAGCVETQFDEKSEDDIVLSFQVFCKSCGQLVGAWDNTNRQRFI